MPIYHESLMFAKVKFSLVCLYYKHCHNWPNKRMGYMSKTKHDQNNVTYTGKIATIQQVTTMLIHQVTTMLATSKNVLFPCHNHLLTTGADDPSL